MSEMQLILNDSFWKFLVSLEELKEKKDKTLFCASLNVDDETLQEFQEFLNRFDVMCESDDAFIYPLKDKCRIKMDFSLSEWLALQASFHKDDDQNNFKHYYQRIVQNKLSAAQKAFEQFNLYRKPADVSVKLSEIENLKKKIDYVICYKKSITIEFFNNKECVVFPHRLVFLDGILCVVGESINDKSLVFFGVEDIKDVKDFVHEYEPNLSQIEVNEFICHLRLINGKEERLILKIYSQYEADLLPSHHFLGNPFVTSNTEGEMIWAATIEMCDDLFQWLYTMKDRAEVLDPGHVRKEFAHYCEIKNENSGLKKVS
ncbi:MAG: WYL domain-containing protein [Bacteriovorax sp.]|nr:WYL domain-containing protein [Bacteriovorax sp.]